MKVSVHEQTLPFKPYMYSLEEGRGLSLKLGTGASQVKVHGVIIFNGWNHSSNEFQEQEEVPAAHMFNVNTKVQNLAFKF